MSSAPSPFRRAPAACFRAVQSPLLVSNMCAGTGPSGVPSSARRGRLTAQSQASLRRSGWSRTIAETSDWQPMILALSRNDRPSRDEGNCRSAPQSIGLRDLPSARFAHREREQIALRTVGNGVRNGRLPIPCYRRARSLIATEISLFRLAHPS